MILYFTKFFTSCGCIPQYYSELFLQSLTLLTALTGAAALHNQVLDSWARNVPMWIAAAFLHQSPSLISFLMLNTWLTSS